LFFSLSSCLTGLQHLQPAPDHFSILQNFPTIHSLTSIPYLIPIDSTMHQASILLFFSFQENSNESQIIIKKDKDHFIDVSNISKEHEAINSFFLEPKKLFFLLSFFEETHDVIGDQIHKLRS
jgi:hypothetical protein